MEGRRTLEVVVTDVMRPERMGVKTESKGSVLCLTDWIYTSMCQNVSDGSSAQHTEGAQ